MRFSIIGKRLRRTGIVLVFALFTLSAQIGLAETVGSLTLTRGIVKIRRNLIDHLYRRADEKIPLQNGDQIQTGFNTRATIRFDLKKDEMVLYANTIFTLKEIGLASDEVIMPAGKVRFKINTNLRRPNRGRKRFRLRTANAIIGVKGTEFVVGVGEGNTNLLTLSGIVTIANVNVPDVEIDVPANQASRIQRNHAPTPPVEIPAEIRGKIIQSDTNEELKEIDYGVTVETAEPDGEKTGTKSGDDPEEEITVPDIEEIADDSGTQSRAIKFRIVN